MSADRPPAIATAEVAELLQQLNAHAALLRLLTLHLLKNKPSLM